MNLVFYDRRTTPAVPPSEALLTIERKGTFSLSIGAVAGLQLQPERSLVLAQDADTNTWYLLLEPQAGQAPFVLRPRDKNNSRALMFCSQPQARAYYEAHGLGELKSVRTRVELTPVAAAGLHLYPLRPQHSTKTPAAPAQPVVATSAPAPEPSTPEAPTPVDVPTLTPAVASEPVAESKPAPASKYTPEMDARLLDMANSPSDLAREWGMSAAALHTRRAQLKKKAGEQAAPVVTPAPATPTLIYTPAPAAGSEPVKKTLGLQARAQELTAYWLEREISRTTPGELAEILNLMRHVPTGTRGIEMQLVLDRAETEQTHRQTVAGKGGNRG